MSADPKAIFLDTNILIYALIEDDFRKARAELVLFEGGQVSVQVLNELASIARQKFRRDWSAVQYALSIVRALCGPAIPMTQATHEEAVVLAARYGFHIYDANVIAVALLAGCTTLYSEDMQDGQTIDGLTIRNPFTAPA